MTISQKQTQSSCFDTLLAFSKQDLKSNQQEKLLTDQNLTSLRELELNEVGRLHSLGKLYLVRLSGLMIFGQRNPEEFRIQRPKHI